MIDEDALPREIRDATPGTASATSLTFPIGMPLAEIEMRVIHETLRHTRGDKRLTAKLLGIATRTIYRRLEPTRGDEPDDGRDDDDARPDATTTRRADARPDQALLLGPRRRSS